MTSFSSLQTFFTRLLWAVSLLLITVGTIQAQTFTITSLTPGSGPVGTTIAIVGDNPTAALATTVTFTSVATSAITTSPAAVTSLPNATTTSLTATVPATLALGVYNVTVQLALTGTGGVVTLFSSTNSLPFTVTALPLPVQLTSFTAESVGNSAHLRWATASEKDNDHFDVEASTDGRTFARVGQVAGHGNTLLPQQYSFTDENLARYTASLVYYRLHQVDGDGTSSFSQVRTVAVAAGGKPVLVLYPTVATEGETTHYAYAGAELAAGATLEIYSLTGQRVLTQPISEATGAINSQVLASGWYWVRLPAAGTTPVRFYHP